MSDWGADRLEAVAEAAGGLDVAGVIRVLFQLEAEAADVDAKVVDLVDVLPAPDLRQQRLVAQESWLSGTQPEFTAV